MNNIQNKKDNVLETNQFYSVKQSIRVFLYRKIYHIFDQKTVADLKLGDIILVIKHFKETSEHVEAYKVLFSDKIGYIFMAYLKPRDFEKII